MSVIVNTISQKGLALIAGHEGIVLKAYLCPGGVVTIGYGFTMGSKIFAQWWRAKHGRALRLGDTMLLSDAEMLLERIVNDEYGKIVAERIKPKKQHHYDGGTSMTYNCGIGATNWKWAQALARGDVAEAARLVRITATTSNGKQLPGLVRRRKEEAQVIETGVYPVAHGVASSLTPAEQIRDRLAKLGFTGATAIEAVKAFQKAKGLTVDGLVGPATRSTLVRAEEGRAQAVTSTGGAVVGGGAGATAETGGELPPVDAVGDAATSGLGGLVVVGCMVLAGWLIWRNRGWLFAGLPEPVKDWFADRGIVLGRRVSVPA